MTISAKDAYVSDPKKKPKRSNIKTSVLPQEMMDADRWVIWEWVWGKNKRWTKVPVGGRTMTMDFKTAMTLFLNDKEDKLAGVGFTTGDGWVGFDLDNHRDPKTGEVTEFAKMVMKKVGGYWEVSPSGTGFKGVVRGHKPAGCKTKCDKTNLEVYEGQFFTITSNATPESVKKTAHLDDGGIWVLENFMTVDVNNYRDDRINIEYLKEAILKIPMEYCDNRHEWITVGMCAKAVSEELREYWVQWSAMSKHHDPDVDPAKWDDLQPTSAGAWGILRRAFKGGYNWPGKPMLYPNDVEELQKKIAEISDNLGRLGTKPELSWVTEEESKQFQIFRRGGKVVKVVDEQIIQVDRGCMTYHIPVVVDIKKTTAKREVSVPPPTWLVDSVLSHCATNHIVRRLDGIITSPTLREDGSVLDDPGYDEQSRLLYLPKRDFPKVYGKDHKELRIEKELARIMDLVKDFPFASNTDRAGFLALLLTLACRPAIAGCVPMFAISGNTAGCGKGRLADIAYAIVHGCPAPKMARPKDAELQKQIPSLARAGSPVMFFDNLTYPLGGEVIEAALTSTIVNSRILGLTEMTGDLPMRMVWIATGNNITYANDFARRVIQIRLNSPLEKPEERTDFEHQDIIGHICGEREQPLLLSSALTLVKVFLDHGSPAPDDRLMGSFESWTRLIRNCVVWLGVGDPLQSKRTVDESTNDDLLTYRLLLAGLAKADPENVGISSRELWRIYKSGFGAEDENPELCDALDHLLERYPNPDAYKVGIALRRLAGRPYEGQALQNRPAGQGIVKWFRKSLADAERMADELF